MSYIERFTSNFAKTLEHDVDVNGWNIADPNAKNYDVLEALETINNTSPTMMTQLERDEIMSMSTINSEGSEHIRKMERYVHEKKRIGGKTLAEVIRLLPNVHYTTDQLVSFIYKHEPIVTTKEIKDEKATSEMLAFIRKRTKKNVTHQQMIEQATKHALLYGRAGLFRNEDNELEFYPSDYYTVVIGYRKNSKQVVPELLGYILYSEPVTQAVLHLSEVPPNTDIDWFKNALDESNSPMLFVEKERMRFVPASQNRFVNLRYDMDSYNPESRLYNERLRIEDSLALHATLNRKFKERGIGRLIIETADDKGTGNAEQGITDLLNSSNGARRKDLGQIKEYAKYLADTIKHMDDDDVLVLPEGLTQNERLENTNTPEKFLDILMEDQNIVPLCYGIPPTLLGLGTLSDRNISIASINETTEDTAINNIRQAFYTQLGLLYGMTDEQELINEDLADQGSIDTHNKYVSEIALNLFKAGFPQDKINEMVTKELLN